MIFTFTTLDLATRALENAKSVLSLRGYRYALEPVTKNYYSFGRNFKESIAAYRIRVELEDKADVYYTEVVNLFKNYEGLVDIC